MSHHLADLGWIDFDSAVPSTLPSCSAHSAKLSSAQAELGRQWNSQDQSQPKLPNPGPRGDVLLEATIHFSKRIWNIPISTSCVTSCWATLKTNIIFKVNNSAGLTLSVPLRHRVLLVARAGAGDPRGVQQREQNVRTDVPIGRNLQGK